MPRQSTSVVCVCEQCSASFLVKPSQLTRGRGKHCSFTCRDASYRVGAEQRHAREIKSFLSRVDRSAGPDACWPFTGNAACRGYGAARWHGKSRTTHRIAYELAYGNPATNLVCHSCDNPRCCNPAHLFDGTHKDNSEDMTTKMRQRHGSACYNARFTEDEVREIRRAWASGTQTIAGLARRFGVAYGTIRHIVDGLTWKHLLTPEESSS